MCSLYIIMFATSYHIHDVVLEYTLKATPRHRGDEDPLDSVVWRGRVMGPISV